MLANRPANERVTDLFLALTAAEILRRAGARPGRLVFQKIIFAAKLALRMRGSKALHQWFYRYKHGPYSEDLHRDEEVLSSHGLTSHFNATDRGREIVARFRSLLERENRAVFATLEQAVRQRARWGSARAKAEAYGLPARSHLINTGA